MFCLIPAPRTAQNEVPRTGTNLLNRAPAVDFDDIAGDKGGVGGG